MQELELNKIVVRIYTLTNPINGEIFYVGRTKNALHCRLSTHNYKSMTKKWDTSLRDYYKTLQEQGIKPLIEEIDRTTWARKKEVEEYWIQQLSSWGFKLHNKRHYVNKSYYVRVPLPYENLSAIDLGIIHRLYRGGDFTEIGKIAKVSREYVRKFFKRHRMPGYIKDAYLKYYRKRAKEVAEWYLLGEESNNHLSKVA